MALLQSHNLFLVSSSSSPKIAPKQNGWRYKASLQNPANLQNRGGLSLPKLQNMINMEELRMRKASSSSSTITNKPPQTMPATATDDKGADLLVAKLHMIAEVAADRAEMHAIIGEQRNNWNSLLLNSINSITLTASIMAGLSTISIGGDQGSPHFLAFKLSSALLYTVATGMMFLVNKIQPSQLAEEQRNATRLFKQLERSIRTTLKLSSTHTELDVEEAMEKVLALDKAYPLPLLPGMLEKFPKKLEPTVWWPKLQLPKRRVVPHNVANNIGNNEKSIRWNEEVEEGMRGLLKVLKEKDEDQYVWFGNLFVKINKCLAISGPSLAGLAAVGAGLIGTPALGQWPVLLAVMGGVLATAVNTLEHGFQIGMLLEMFRNCAGFYKKLGEEIELNLDESTEMEKRENLELFEMHMALQLGRRVSELKDFAPYASPSVKGDEFQGFAGKLF
ncbi:hypothetical protein J5N97_025750 [Dioscorea zingiberensis]|uniref:F-box protein n=1 Tax=Dioscorea zingiberensis TaxID=325984 RepID=A0A9D5C0V7_9LILI|nr:hypothetical protein J5N97_025750 [Dioscorea zingiberensis]